MVIKEVEGDLIELARKWEFDVIGHGCNCFCNMGSGIAVPMKNTFGCDKFPLEAPQYKGDKSKLGKIDYQEFEVSQMSIYPVNYKGFSTQELRNSLFVVNCYTQYFYGKGKGGGAPIDYDALRSCMREINFFFPGKRIGLPKIGAGLAGGDWDKIKGIIQEELKDCQVTVIIFNK